MKRHNNVRHPSFRISGFQTNWEKATYCWDKNDDDDNDGGKMGETLDAAHGRVDFVNGTDFHAQPTPPSSFSATILDWSLAIILLPFLYLYSYLASQDAIEVMSVTDSLTERSHWLDWYDPGERWYL